MEKSDSNKDVSFAFQYFVCRLIQHASNLTLLDWNQPAILIGYKANLQQCRPESRNLTTFKMKLSSIIVNSWKLLAIVAKSSSLVSCDKVPGSICFSIYGFITLSTKTLWYFLFKSTLENDHNILVNLNFSNTINAGRTLSTRS